MQEEKKEIETSEDIDVIGTNGNNTSEDQDNILRLQKEIEEVKEKYLRLYAEFENYKRKTQKDREELIKYSNEALIYEILPIVDSIEMAIKHSLEAQNEGVNALRQGVENTLREIYRTLEKFGVSPIQAKDKPFDPTLHHAMSQVERDDIAENTVVEEFRKGYILKDKVIRPSLVVVSKKTDK
ncbi:MAG: nucleotide exchange factor GrpE [Thermodesulfovibrionales bacterium]|nr:nucleotide exchange factor GrpE [Thermodesulfovibrionales bacterium]